MDSSESMSVKLPDSGFQRLFPVLPSALKEQQKLRHHLLKTRSGKETTRSSRQIPPPLWTFNKSSSMRRHDYTVAIKSNKTGSLDEVDGKMNNGFEKTHEVADVPSPEQSSATSKTERSNAVFESNHSRCLPGEDSEMARRLWLRRWLTSGEVDRKMQLHRQHQSAEIGLNHSSKETGSISTFSVDLALSIINLEVRCKAEQWIYEMIRTVLEPTDRVLLLASTLKNTNELQLRFAIAPTTLNNKSSINNNWRRVGLALFRLFGSLVNHNESSTPYHLGRFHISANCFDRTKGDLNDN